MRIERYCPLTSDEPVFEPVMEILIRHKIKHNLNQIDPGSPRLWLNFRIYENHPAWSELEPFIGSYPLCIPKYIFSSKELHAREIVAIRKGVIADLRRFFSKLRLSERHTVLECASADRNQIFTEYYSFQPVTLGKCVASDLLNSIAHINEVKRRAFRKGSRANGFYRRAESYR